MVPSLQEVWETLFCQQVEAPAPDKKSHATMLLPSLWPCQGYRRHTESSAAALASTDPDCSDCISHAARHTTP